MSEQVRTSNLMALDGYLAQLGKSAKTAQRWRKKGLLTTVNIYGRLYITTDEIARFETRALSGEFAKKNPKAK